MLSGISIWQLLIILLIVVLLFGTKKLKGMGADLGSAIKGFKSAVKDGEDEQKRNLENPESESTDNGTTIDQNAKKTSDKDHS